MQIQGEAKHTDINLKCIYNIKSEGITNNVTAVYQMHWNLGTNMQ